MSRDSSARRSARFNEVATKLNERTAKGHVIEATLEFITPMFGGGVALNTTSPHHKEPDWVTPVRGASLRGQLRAWWRRTCGQGLGPDALRAREALLWGWASTQDDPAKGLVAISVDGRKLRPEKVQVYTGTKPVDGFGAPLAYGAFPLQPAQAAQDKNAGTLTRWRNTFTVRLELVELAREPKYLARAQQAWGQSGERLQTQLGTELDKTWAAFVTFGGLGGRTRRGFGAIQQTTPPAPSLERVATLLNWSDRIAHFGVNDGPEQAQRRALAKLQGFRQGKNVGRNPGDEPNRPGRSRWPEPDALRRLRGRHAPKHAPVHVVGKYARAAFGMPIIVHFKDPGEPVDQSIQPAGAERLASPLILRPVRDSTGCYAVALKLPGEKAANRVLDRLEVRQGKVTTGAQSGALSAEEQGKIPPLAEFRDKAESGLNAVLNPFLNYFLR